MMKTLKKILESLEWNVKWGEPVDLGLYDKAISEVDELQKKVLEDSRYDVGDLLILVSAIRSLRIFLKKSKEVLLKKKKELLKRKRRRKNSEGDWTWGRRSRGD